MIDLLQANVNKRPIRIFHRGVGRDSDLRSCFGFRKITLGGDGDCQPAQHQGGTPMVGTVVWLKNRKGRAEVFLCIREQPHAVQKKAEGHVA